MFVVVLLLGLGVLSTASAQGPVERLEIVGIDPGAFPVVELRFRALDAANRPVPGIPRTDMTIQDGETQATAETPREENGPLTVHFVIETGISLDQSGWLAAREAVRAFGAGEWMGDGSVQAAVSIVRGRELVPLIPPTSDAAAIANMAHESNPGSGELASAMPALSDLLAEMERQSPSGAQAVVFLTRQLESNTGYDTVVTQSRETGIPIYTALLRSTVRPNEAGSDNGTPTPPPLDELVEELATDTGGLFTLMAEDARRMVPAYDDLSARRRQYAVAYRVSDSQPGTRNVTVSLPGGAGDSISYDMDIEPPRVLIRTPENGDVIARQIQSAGGDASAAVPTDQQVVAIVGFGQNPERRVRRATLRVDDVEVDSADIDIGEALTINLSWDMRSVTMLGDSSHTLVVEVVDELGLTDSASARVTVRITQPEIVATPPPPPAPTATPIPCISPSPLCERIERPIRENPVAAVSLLVAFLALLLAALMWINRGKAPVQRMTQTVRRGFDRLTNRYRRSEVRAYLELLAGDGDVGHRYEIYGDTPIGRSRQNAELLFQQEAENSPISRLHCTITDEEDHFMIRDEDSANGTYLNGERLPPVVPYRLKDGDLIELARVERGGVRLRFVAATPEDTVPPLNPGYTYIDGQVSSQQMPPDDQTRGRF